METSGKLADWGWSDLKTQEIENLFCQEAGNGRVDKKKAGQIYDRLIQCEQKKLEDIHRLQMLKLCQEKNSCTFQPELVSVGTKKHHNKSTHSSKNPISLRNSKELHERVDEIIKERNLKVAMKKADDAVLREEEFKGICTFKPKINKSDLWSQGSKPKVADIDSWKQKLQERLFEEYFESKSHPNPTFTPTISKNSEKLLRAKSPNSVKERVEDRLYNLSKSKSGKQLNQSPLVDRRTISASQSTSRFSVKQEQKIQNSHPKEGSVHKVISVAQLCADIEKHKSGHRSSSAVSKKSGFKSPRKSPIRIFDRNSRQSSQQKLSQASFHNFESADKENPQKKPRLKKRKQEGSREGPQVGVPKTNSFTLLEEQGSILSEIPNHINQTPTSNESNKMRPLKDRTSNKTADTKQSTPQVPDKEPRSFDPESIPEFLGNILANPTRTKIAELLPKDRTKIKSDGRQYLRIGEQKIFYREEDLQDIINFSLRAKTFC